MEGYLVLDSDFFQNKNFKNTIILGSTALGTGILSYLFWKKFISNEKNGLKSRKLDKINLNNLQRSQIKQEFQSQEKGLQIFLKTPPGLHNFGNTCFANSILQAFAALPKFINCLDDLCYKCQSIQGNDKQIYNLQILLSLLEILKELNKDDIKENEYIVPQNLIGLFEQQNDYLNFVDQQDSHELMKLLLDCFSETVNLRNKLEKFNLKQSFRIDRKYLDCFQGYNQVFMQCCHCNHQFNIKLETFNDLSLDIVSRDVNSIKQALDNYFKDEYIEGVNCLKCSATKFVNYKKKAQEQFNKNFIQNGQKPDYLQLKVLGYLNEQIQFVNIQYKKSSAEVEKLQGDVQKLISDQVYNLRLEKGGDKYVAYIADAFDRVKQRVVRKTQITVYPQILILHIKRLVMNPYGQFQKVYKQIDFDEEMQFQTSNNNNLNGSLNQSLNQSLNLKSLQQIENKNMNESEIIDKNQNSDNINLQKNSSYNNKNTIKYALSSIVSHLGNDNFGHYVTFRKSWHQQTLDTKIIGSGNQIYKNAHWFYTSDRDTGFVDKYEIKRANAYILMYSLEDCEDIMEE